MVIMYDDDDAPLDFAQGFQNMRNKRGIKISNPLVKSKKEETHTLVIHVSLDGLMSIVKLTLYDRGDGRIFSRPDALNIDWETIERAVLPEWTVFPPGSRCLEVRVQTEHTDDMRVCAPFLRSRMPRAHSAGMLSMSYAPKPRAPLPQSSPYPIWEQWTDEDDSAVRV